MSGGSGGFYKYRCKYFYSHNCSNWVWVNNAPCASCLAEGRDDSNEPAGYWTRSRDIVVPRVHHGTLQYKHMELVAPSAPGHDWTLQDKDEKKAAPPAIPVTSVVPAPIAAGFEV